MHIIGVQDKSGFELVLSKKKRYLFKNTSQSERDEWVEVLKKYTAISNGKQNLPDMLSSSKDKEKQQVQTEQHSISSLEDEDVEDQEMNNVALTEVGDKQCHLQDSSKKKNKKRRQSFGGLKLKNMLDFNSNKNDELALK